MTMTTTMSYDYGTCHCSSVTGHTAASRAIVWRCHRSRRFQFYHTEVNAERVGASLSNLLSKQTQFLPTYEYVQVRMKSIIRALPADS